jgi:O-antigen/teichoic acid export membrane protein
MYEKKRGAIYKGFAWKWLERTGVQGVKFIIQIILARLLSPEEYGVVALLAVFISIADILVQSGFSSALIQKIDTDEHDFATVLWAGLGISAIIYAVLFLAAPLIAKFYSEDILEPVLRVLALLIFIIAINSIQVAKLSREINFKLIFFGNTIANVISGIIAIIAAYLGAGVWSLVAQQILSYLFYTAFLAIKFKIKLGRFSIQRLKPLFSFGWKLALSNVIATLTENLYNLIIGRTYSTEMVGYYSRGQQFPLAFCSSINQTISGVMFPVMSSMQEDIERVKSVTRKTISASTFVVFPIVIGLAVVAEPMVKLFLTDKWLPSVPFLQLECAFYATLPMMYASGQAIKATGHTQVSLILESTKTLLTLVLILVLYRFVSIYIIVGMRAAISLVIVFMQDAFSKKYIGYAFKERIADIMPNLLSTLLMAVLVYLVGMIAMPTICTFILQVITGVIVYAGIAILTHNQNLTLIKEMVANK